MAWEPYSCKRENLAHQTPQNLTYTQSPTTQRHLLQQKETTTSTNVNYWPSLKPSPTGDHTSSGPKNPSRSSLTTQIYSIGKSPRKLNQRTARWHEELQDYYFELQHTPGRLHTAADALSQPFGSDEGKDDNREVTMIPEKSFI